MYRDRFYWLGRATALIIVLGAIKIGGLWGGLAVLIPALLFHFWYRWRYGRWCDY